MMRDFAQVSVPRVLLLCLLTALCWTAQAFSLDELQAQLRATPVVRGHFIQQKFLRSLEQPLTSKGNFTLANGRGLLWLMRSPIEQALRITANGISRRGEDGSWQALPQHMGSSRENRLFLAVLAGDTQGLRENFELTLSGTPQQWQLLMTPRSAMLSQIFDSIQVTGGAQVSRIELRETQGDRSVLQMQDLQAATELNAEDQHALRN